MNDGPPADPADHLGGNAAAGPLQRLFAVDLTTAVGRCAGCGSSGPLAEAPQYGPDPGLALRCPGCDGVLLRLVSTADRAWLDMRGLSSLQVRW